MIVYIFWNAVESYAALIRFYTFTIYENQGSVKRLQLAANHTEPVNPKNRKRMPAVKKHASAEPMVLNVYKRPTEEPSFVFSLCK